MIYDYLVNNIDQCLKTENYIEYSRQFPITSLGNVDIHYIANF